MTPKGLAFQSEDSFLSKLFPVQVRFNGRVFPSSEHAYQFDRAQYIGNHQAANDIFFAPTSKSAKKVAGRLGHSKEWDLVKLDRMSQIVHAEFKQNPRLGSELLKTGPSNLIEATLDNFWGCGYTLTARNLLSGQWHGRNHLGVILVNCRTELNRELYGQQPLGFIPPQLKSSEVNQNHYNKSSGVTEIKEPTQQTSYEQTGYVNNSYPPIQHESILPSAIATCVPITTNAKYQDTAA